MRVLFVCTQNICRSRVAEEVFRALAWNGLSQANHEARSAGTHPSAGGRPLRKHDVEWADVICAMEPAHAAFIQARWPAHGDKIRVLGIPDIYMPTAADLRELCAQHVRDLLGG